MIILITAVPGSGKTLYAVELIQQYVQEGRTVFADINGLLIDGVEQSPVDWRECPDGSVVVYDECQQRFGPDGAGRSGNPIISDLETHRHRGMDIILITQHPRLLHAHVRRLVGRHHHLFRMYGTQTAKIFTREGQIDVDKPSQLKDQDCRVWSYPKSCFGLYKSASIHTHKRQFPSWLKRSFLLGGVAVPVVAFLFYLSADFFSGAAVAGLSAQAGGLASDKKPVQIKDDSTSTTLPDWFSTARKQPELFADNEIVTVACIYTAVKCRCYESDGNLLDLSLDQCKRVALQPLVKIPSYKYDQSFIGRATVDGAAATDGATDTVL